MDNNQKKINFRISSSVDLSVYSIEKLERFWHQELELIYVLSGSINVQCRNIEYNLHKDDIILINMFDIHTLSANQSEILSLKINISNLDSEISHFSQNRFDCNSSIESDKSKFIPLKQLLASLVKSNVNLDDNLEFLNKSYLYELLYILVTYFKIEDNHSTYTNKNSEKIMNILNYVNENYEKKYQ